MKIAVIDHMVNFGGGSRVLRNLLPAIKKLKPEWTLTFYSNHAAVRREGLQNDLSPYLEIKKLKSVQLANLSIFEKIRGSKTIFSFIQKKFKKPLSILPFFFSGDLSKEIEKLSKNHDLLFCTWPYLIECPNLHPSIPVVSIFHDFCFRYYFTGQTIHPVNLRQMEEELPKWLHLSIPVVSTHFMKQELEKFYPQFGSKTKVIHLAPLGAGTQIDRQDAERAVKSLGISSPYLLYPTNTSCHKNIGNLIAAFHLIAVKHPNLKLVLAGFGTENINGTTTGRGIILDRKNRNVIGLGYVSNLQIEALIQCAAAVVSSSFYEAGCGPGLDAWFRGVPVAMSNIPSFMEHLEVQGVRAQVFDPFSSPSIADAIEAILNQPEKARADALYSQQKIAGHDWSSTAQKYIAVFEQALDEKMRQRNCASR